MDIHNGAMLFEELSKVKSSVTLFNVTDEEISEVERSLIDDLQTVKGTMKIHQIHTSVSGQIMWRVLSCFCRNPDPCTCFSPQCVTFAPVSEPSLGALHQHPPTFQETKAIQPIPDINEELIGKWCVVLYDNDPYPGIIQDIDTESCALVKTMHSVGANRFYWPMKDDVICAESQTRRQGRARPGRARPFDVFAPAHLMSLPL
ncbi:unnamed protein product [Gadus morhua 'NCC']